MPNLLRPASEVFSSEALSILSKVFSWPLFVFFGTAPFVAYLFYSEILPKGASISDGIGFLLSATFISGLVFLAIITSFLLGEFYVSCFVFLKKIYNDILEKFPKINWFFQYFVFFLGRIPRPLILRISNQEDFLKLTGVISKLTSKVYSCVCVLSILILINFLFFMVLCLVYHFRKLDDIPIYWFFFSLLSIDFFLRFWIEDSKSHWRVVCWLVLIAILIYIMSPSLDSIGSFIDGLNKAILPYSDDFQYMNAFMYFSILSLFINFCVRYTVSIFVKNTNVELNGVPVSDGDIYNSKAEKVIGAMHVVFFIFVVVFLLSTSISIFIKHISYRAVLISGLRQNNVKIVVEPEFYKEIIGSLNGSDGLLGCSNDDGVYINNVTLLWHGLGDTSFLKFSVPTENSKGGLFLTDRFEIPREKIKGVVKMPQTSSYCINFEGPYFEKGSYKINESDFSDVDDYIFNTMKAFSNKPIEKIVIDWESDPIEIKSNSNLALSEARAREVSKRIISSICKERKGFPYDSCHDSIQYSGVGPINRANECKDWPNPKTQNECLAKNRGGKITVYVKNY